MGRVKTSTGRKVLHRLGLVSGPPLEADEQAEIFAYLKTLTLCWVPAKIEGLTSQPTSAWDFAFAVPNGSVLAGDAGQRARQMASMKRQGLKPAVSDIFLALPRGGKHGMFIEMKRVKLSKTTAEQLAWAALMNSAGYHAVIAKGAADAKALIKAYLAA